LKALKKYWWLIALRGVLGIIVGIFAIVWPGISLAVFLLLLAVYLLVEGVLLVLSGLFSMGKDWHWLALLLEGALALVVGWIIISNPGSAVLTLAFLVQILALWLILGGVLRVVLAIAVRKKIKNEFFLIGSGILSVLVGFWIFSQPGIGLLALIWLFGFSAIVMGIFYTAFGMRLKEVKA